MKSVDGDLHSYKIILPSYKFSRGKIATIILKKKFPAHICPVMAMREFLRIRTHGSEFMFTFPDGTPCTRKWFSGNLAYLLRKSGKSGDCFGTHSFRVGMATDMALAGLSVTQIKLRGRWESYSFIRYLRPRCIVV